MADLGVMFDANTVEPMQSLEPVPAGDYTLIVDSSERVSTKAGDGELLKTSLTIVDGEYKGRKIFFNFNLWNKNQTAKEIAWRQFSGLCRACGKYQPVGDSAALHDIPFRAKVKIRPAKGEYEAQNDIAEFYEKGTSGTNAPVAQQVATSKPATTSSGKPPWM